MTVEHSADLPTGTAICEHRVRTREIELGFASALTTCASCGQAFDPDEEQALRDRDRGRST
jgi:hypothetical protein